MPEFGEDQNLEKYLSVISNLVAANHWELVTETWLSLLSFLKINMYNDLIKHKDRVIDNVNVRAIAGDATASNKIPQDLIDFNYDKNLKSIDIFQVVDADSSQQDAVLSDKKD